MTTGAPASQPTRRAVLLALGVLVGAAQALPQQPQRFVAGREVTVGVLDDQALPVGEAARNEIVVRTFADEQGHAVIEVCDTGPGIPVHIAGRIFEPFVTTKPREVGTGLGLSICHNIVTSLGGHISAHPRSPRGTVCPVSSTIATRFGVPERPCRDHSASNMRNTAGSN